MNYFSINWKLARKWHTVSALLMKISYIVFELIDENHLVLWRNQSFFNNGASCTNFQSFAPFTWNLSFEKKIYFAADMNCLRLTDTSASFLFSRLINTFKIPQKLFIWSQIMVSVDTFCVTEWMTDDLNVKHRKINNFQNKIRLPRYFSELISYSIIRFSYSIFFRWTLKTKAITCCNSSHFVQSLMVSTLKMLSLHSM